MTGEVVTVTREGGVVTLTMDDERRRNALTAEMLAGLCAGFEGVGADSRAVVLRAAPGHAVWCAGFDIGALSAGFDPLDPAGALAGLFRLVHACPAPVIGMLHGSAWGGGTDLALRCDMLIGDPTASLAFTPAKLGLPYDADGLRNAVWRAGPALAMEMFATGEPVGAERALAAGLLNRKVAEEALEGAVYGLARQIAGNAPLVVRSVKAHVRAIVSGGGEEGLAAGRRAALESADYAEGLGAFRDRRKALFVGR